MTDKKYERPYEKIGDRIREIRKNMKMSCKGRKMSQEDLAELLGIDPKLLSRIETGVQEIPSTILQRLSQITGKSMEYILTGQEIVNYTDETLIILCLEFSTKLMQILKK